MQKADLILNYSIFIVDITVRLLEYLENDSEKVKQVVHTFTLNPIMCYSAKTTRNFLKTSTNCTFESNRYVCTVLKIVSNT